MSEREFEFINTEDREGIFIITLDRPQARNAINSAMWAELCDAFFHFDRSDDLSVAIITNTGKVFCAGADLKEYNTHTLNPPVGRESWGTGGMTRRYWDKPIILAANGKVVGGGAEMLLASDLALLSSDGSVSFPEVKNALFPGGGGAPLRIGRSIHLKHAVELLLTGKPIDADTALAWGLVNHVVAEEDLLDAAMDLARSIMDNGPLAVRMTKRAIYDCMDKSFLSESSGWRMMEELNERAKASADAQEGTTAFKEKRKPVWSGR